MIAKYKNALYFRIMKRWVVVLAVVVGLQAQTNYILIPMDETQTDHLKAYGITYWVLQHGVPAEWLLNYRGGSFVFPYLPAFEEECIVRGVRYEILSPSQYAQMINQIRSESTNQDAIRLEKAPKIAVYSPKTAQPWDDAVTLVLTYAEIPYDVIYDGEVLEGKLKEYDWLHLHHEDFTGQYGKFWATYRNTPWYKQMVAEQESLARRYGFAKVSQLKLAVVKAIKKYVEEGGFLFAMCSATDTYDIALAAHKTDICGPMFDGDPIDPQCQEKLDYSQCIAFQNFHLELNPYVYEFSDIDVTNYRRVPFHEDYFTLFEFSAKWDPIPSMLCQNHTKVIKGFMGQTTAFNKKFLKPHVLVMAELKPYGEARYIHGNLGKGMWTFYGGHDPEDYQHFVYEPPTDLSLHKNSPGYRLILNNVLFPAARKKKRKT